MSSILPFNLGNGLNVPNVGGLQVNSCFQEEICPRLNMADVVGFSMRLSNATTKIKNAGLNTARAIGISFLNEDELSRLSACIWASISYPKKIFSTSNDPNACDAKSKVINIRDLVKYFYDFIFSAIDLDIRNSRTELDPNSLVNTLFPKVQREMQAWNCTSYLGHQRSALSKCETREKDCRSNLNAANVYKGWWSQCEEQKGNCTQELQTARVDKNVLDRCAEEQSQCEIEKAQCEADKIQSGPNWSDLCEQAKGDCERKLETEIGKANANWQRWDQCKKDHTTCQQSRDNYRENFEKTLRNMTTYLNGWDQCKKDHTTCQQSRDNYRENFEKTLRNMTTYLNGWDQCKKDHTTCQQSRDNYRENFEKTLRNMTTYLNGWDQCKKDHATCQQSRDNYRGNFEQTLRNMTTYLNGWDQCKTDKAHALEAFKTANETAKSYKTKWDDCLLTEKNLRSEIDEHAQSINRYKKALENESIAIAGFNLRKNIFWNGVVGCTCAVLGFLFGLIASRCRKNRPKGQEEWDETQETELETNKSVMIENFARPSDRWGSSNTSDDELRKLCEFRINQKDLDVDKKLPEKVELLSSK